MCPGKSRQSWTTAKPQLTAQQKSQDTIISPSSPPKIYCREKGKEGKKRARVSKRQTKQNKIGEPANDHKAPWPYVTNKGRERRDNVRQVVLIKGIAVPSVDHFTNC